MRVPTRTFEVPNFFNFRHTDFNDYTFNIILKRLI